MKKLSIKTIARFAGFLYLVVAITGFYSFYVSEKIGAPVNIAEGDIAGLESLFRLSMLSNSVLIIVWVWLGIVFMRMFEHTSKTTSRLLFASVLMGASVVCANTLFHFFTLRVALNPPYLEAFSAARIQSVAVLFLDLATHSSKFAALFFGLWLFPLAYLILKSRLFPGLVAKILFALLVIAGIGYLIDFVAFFLLPGIAISVGSYTFWGELFLLLWLLVRGASLEY